MGYSPNNRNQLQQHRRRSQRGVGTSVLVDEGLLLLGSELLELMVSSHESGSSLDTCETSDGERMEGRSGFGWTRRTVEARRREERREGRDVGRTVDGEEDGRSNEWDG